MNQSARQCGTVVRATRLVNGKPRYLDPGDQKPLNRSTSNLIAVITSVCSPDMQTLVFLPLRGAGLHSVRLSSSVSIFFNPPLFFYLLAHLYRSHLLTDFRDLWLKRRVFTSSTVRPFWGANKKIYIFHYFSQKSENYNGKDRQNIQISITSFLYKISKHLSLIHI